MDFLGIGTSEILVIAVVALIVFGPQRLPELARTLAKMTKMFREASREIQNQLESQDWDKPARKPTPKIGQTTTPKIESTTGTATAPSASPYNFDSTYSNGGSDNGSGAAPDTTTETKSSAATPAGSEPTYSSTNETATVAASAPAPVEPAFDPVKEGDAQRFAREMNN